MSGRRPNQRNSPGESGVSADAATAAGDSHRLLQGERQNDDRLDHLHSQVSTLKAITIEIGTEVREQNKLLDSMGLDFDRTGSMLSQTMHQLRALTQTEQGRTYLWYTVLFSALILLLIFVRAIF